MTGQPQPAPPPERPSAGLIRLEVGNLHHDEWCERCKALTGFTADVVAVHDDGVTVVGTVTGCVICFDEIPGVPRG
jgi:hypothetical protein